MRQNKKHWIKESFAPMMHFQAAIGERCGLPCRLRIYKTKDTQKRVFRLCELNTMDQSEKTEMQTSEAFAFRRGGATKRVRDDF